MRSETKRKRKEWKGEENNENGVEEGGRRGGGEGEGLGKERTAIAKQSRGGGRLGVARR